MKLSNRIKKFFTTKIHRTSTAFYDGHELVESYQDVTIFKRGKAKEYKNISVASSIRLTRITRPSWKFTIDTRMDNFFSEKKEVYHSGHKLRVW